MADRRAHETVSDWFDAYVDEVYRFAARRVGVDDAHDVVADTFRLALERQGGFDPQRGVPRAWLFGIATNLIRQQWRTERRRIRALDRAARTSDRPIDPLLRVDGRLDAAVQAAGLSDAIADLRPEDRDVLLLTAWEGFNSTEIAEVLHIAPGTVRSRLHRARTQLESAAQHIDQGGIR